MRPPDNRNAGLAPGVGRESACSRKQADNSPNARALQLAAATKRLNAFTETLKRMADWRDDLATRLWRAQIRFEHAGLDPDEHDRLAEEVHAFHSTCFSLADSRKHAADHGREIEAA